MEGYLNCNRSESKTKIILVLECDDILGQRWAEFMYI